MAAAGKVEQLTATLVSALGKAAGNTGKAAPWAGDEMRGKVTEMLKQAVRQAPARKELLDAGVGAEELRAVDDLVTEAAVAAAATVRAGLPAFARNLGMSEAELGEALGGLAPERIAEVITDELFSGA
ncbi:hypothetical protein [Amycolatopsis sp. NPDC051071]|uniref:hypothetical protein n=1 Tax=Amycolatopsis sp. NPDC051071 TaxID=3154637 RepID=UPI0034391793